MAAEEVSSPCISVCVLNDSDICEGCYRSAQEITDWGISSNEQKMAVMLNVKQRHKELNKHLLL